MPFFFFAACEGVLKIIDYGDYPELFINAGAPFADFKKVNPQIGKRFFGRQTTIPTPANDLFYQKKPADGFRIFVLGESTALGFPYGNLLMFSRILQTRLQDTFPDRTIEVINTSLTAINSFALLNFVDEIMAQEPDAVMIYCGHNEFYGALGAASFEAGGLARPLVLTLLWVNKTRTFQLYKNVFNHLFYRNKLSVISDGTLMERISTKQMIPLNSRIYRKTAASFKANLNAILSTFQQRHVPVLISELVSNVGDQPPFDENYINHSAARDLYDQAQSFLQSGKIDQAQISFYAAKDQDQIRFRATEEFNDIIHQTAKQHDAFVVPMIKYFEDESENKVIGNKLMADHLHPNKKGYFLMADGFYRTMVDVELIQQNWQTASSLPAELYEKEWPFTSLDNTLADVMIKQIKSGWPFSQKERSFLSNFQPRIAEEILALQVIREEMDVAAAHLRLAEYYDSIDRNEQAAKELEVIPFLTPIDAYTHLRRAKAFLRCGNQEQALDHLNKSLQQEFIPQAARLAGEVLMDKGDYENAAKLFDRAVQRTPHHEKLVIDLITVNIKLQNFIKAQEFLNQFKKSHPNSIMIGELEKMVVN